MVVLHAGRVVAFAQLLPVFVDKQAQMGKLRGLPAECLVQLDVFWSGNKPFLRRNIQSAQFVLG